MECWVSDFSLTNIQYSSPHPRTVLGEVSNALNAVEHLPATLAAPRFRLGISKREQLFIIGVLEVNAISFAMARGSGSEVGYEASRSYIRASLGSATSAMYRFSRASQTTQFLCITLFITLQHRYHVPSRLAVLARDGGRSEGRSRADRDAPEDELAEMLCPG